MSLDRRRPRRPAVKRSRTRAADQRRADASAQLWRALADPTRRAILDHLREGPRTTGGLAAAFSSSRFAVMKHLTVLAGARLVVSRKQGRERWNHLNAVPLERLFARWVRPYEAHAARSLRHFARSIEEGETMAAHDSPAEHAARTDQVELEIPIAAPPERVWHALCRDIQGWWPQSYLVGSAVRGLHLEPRVGGRLYEDWGDGAGVLWYTVVAVDAPRSMHLSGTLFPAFGGPALSFLSLTLEPRGPRTLLKLSDAVLGRVGPDSGRERTEGWRDLFEGGLKRFVEGEAP
jgi:DNA-binding transcriptional ArsR family regulator/uncharacterized protein YndB with AHSA1/START domain